ncbi:uncharacterized protein Tco025E_00180 [Trypanosoma conorhini]|uniref:Importin N-terminal domain-containing protein n=1 Tax=Trypanosoma conorhini TaxID=83891 RepID=A0A3R7PZS6_9TRYP|nr:uncharacterized protein Tco025E_00180 [Trypanosoma conorhini]RNF27530.1 hypothetical protein Tco025E_00180 [Trypanosoma conorhini]
MAAVAAAPAEVGLGLEQLQGMLHTILNSTDNNERRGVESNVVRALSSPSNLMLLVRVVQEVQTVSAGVRQLAAVLLRKKISSLWSAIPMESRAELKRVLLAQLGFEPVRVVRFALAHLISRLAKADTLETGEGWPELQVAIRAAVEDPRGDMRELAMVLAYSIAEVVGEGGGGLGTLVTEAVLQGMTDAEVGVQRAALKAMGALLLFVDLDGEDAAAAARKKREREQLLQRLAPRCLELLATCASLEERTSVCVDVLDLLEQLVEDLSVRRHGAILHSLGLEMISVLCNTSNQPRVRQGSSEVLVTLVNLKPKFVTTALLQPMVAACVQVMGEDGTISLPEVAHVEDSENDGEDNNLDEAADMLHVNPPCMYAGRLLSTLATKVSAKSFTSALLPFVSQVSENPQAGPLERKAAILSLACLAEGNPGYLRRKVQYVLKLTHDFLHDSSHIPREAAAFALAYFCLHLQPEVLTHHQQLFPMLVPLLRDEHDGVCRRVAGALDTLCENVAEDVEPYVPLVLPAVLEAIGRVSLETQRALCGVISSLAITRSPSFQAHATQCLELLKTPLTMTSPETILLRAKATEAVGIVANAIGKETFMPFLPFFIERVADNFHTRQAELREESFGFLSNLCETLRADFMPYLSDSIGCALQTINEDRTHYENKHLLAEGCMRHVNIHVGEEKTGDEDSAESEGESDAEEIHARVRTADVEEKSSAVYFIGVCAEVLLADFGTSRIDVCWAVLIELDAYFHSSIRCSALVTLAKLTKAAQGSESVVKSLADDTLTSHARRLLESLIADTLLPCIHEETDKEVVAAACDALALLFDYFGPQTLCAGADAFVQAATALLRQATACQQSHEDEDDDEDEEQQQEGESPPTGAAAVELGEDHDGVLMDAACDMIESFAKAYGPSVKAYADVIFPFLLPYAADDRPSEDVVMATGCLATIIEAMGAASEPYVEDAAALALHLIDTTDESAAKANCAYLLRALVECCPGHFENASATNPVLQALWGIAGSQDEIPAAVDNAVSATCTMVRCLSPTVIPLSSVVPALLERIPMRVDRTENANAIRTLIHLLTSQREFTRSHVWAPMVRCVATVLAALTVEEEQKRLLVAQGLIPCIGTCRNEWRQACAQLPVELQAVLERHGCCC